MARDLTGIPIGNDNEANLVFVLNIGGTIVRAAERDITLSGNLYTSQLFTHDSLSDMAKIIDISSGGTTGGVGNCSIKIPRDSSNAIASDFINSFYPSTGKAHLDSTIIDIGMTWLNNSTLESHILSIKSFYVEDIDTDHFNMILSLIETSEIESKLLPQYSVQQDFDNSISYFPDAPDESVGSVIPIIYGEYDNAWAANKVYDNTAVGYAPMVLVDSLNMHFAVCSHPVKSTSYTTSLEETGAEAEYTFRYDVDADIYIKIYHKAITDVKQRGVINNLGKYVLKLGGQWELANKLVSHAYIPLKTRGSEGNIEDVENIIDEDVANYITVGIGNTVSLKSLGKVDGKNIGTPTGDAADVKLIFTIASNSGAIVNSILYASDLTSTSILNIVAQARATSNTTLHTEFASLGDMQWKSSNIQDASQFLESDFRIYNSLTSSDSMRVSMAYIEFKDFSMSQVNYKQIKIAIPYVQIQRQVAAQLHGLTP